MNGDDISRIDLNLLKVFEALYEEGGASRAALRLDLTQSAVSAALARLRVLYADPLFVRTGRGLAPTPRADELKPILSDALDRCRQSLAIAADSGDRLGRTISLGLSDDFEIALGSALIAAVAKEAAGIRLIFRQTHSGIAGDALLRHGVDLAIASGGFSASGLSRRAVATGGYACLIDPAARARSARALTLADYLRHDHLLVSSGGVIGIVDEALAALGHKRRVAASTTHFAALPYLLLGTAGIATIPAHAARAIARTTPLRCVACPVELSGYPVEIGWRTSTQRDPAIVRVRDTVAACIERIVRP
ncbi:LysR family transcriptional regulator [Burkholderia ubonensis]|uniref:LysR substrate-binding domain-containing protein n=1 Tax=Burkholderia ubonensis TaxID=101571 RepID=UPI000752AA08|nr:LysR substrate-binding domain-containing protein [Burkholderia ubonensis]KVU42408.1 LysR family transcriptional regulator [Burkholderia ubonensis]KWD51943.1 LysR family transcriptional regulator [Burkholderia ubonensis]KWD69601.1 LysR family transcriptional regulator [Burkholderia ubonensis]